MGPKKRSPGLQNVKSNSLSVIMPTQLTIELLQAEASNFAKIESKHAEPSLFGVTDGKAVGTYLEHKFQASLQSRYT